MMAMAVSARCHHGGMNRAVHALAADLPQLATSLASAFRDDPVAVWMFDDPATLERLIG